MKSVDNTWRQISETKITAGGKDHYLYVWIRDADQAARVTTGPVYSEKEFVSLDGALGYLLPWTVAIGVIHATDSGQQVQQ
ncbi:hypothetical protein ABH935_007009 [Catenulispora sp. GAS73]|uniref:hypothetical protein n=1 Tax=Catenulispora sp. GAS73 TaxID=3156269 RepID=UPI003518236B